MSRVRFNRRFGSLVALFALAIQLALSFGHIHVEDILGPTATKIVHVGGQANTPADNDHDGPGHDVCAICAALSLTASSVLPTVELPATPVEHAYQWTVAVRPAQVSFGINFSFQARAPPVSI